MSDNKKSLNKHLYDALLDISENDSAESKSLLEASGINSNEVLKLSLEKIAKHQSTLADKVRLEEESNLFKSIKKKINILLTESPERTNQFLTGYFQQHSLNVQFQNKTKINNQVLAKAKDKMDLKDLDRKLDKKDFF